MPGAETPSSFRQGLHDWSAVALAELRSVRRLARTWVFLGLGIAVMGTTYTYYSYVHATTSASGLSGTFLPRFTTAYFNSYVLWFFMAALVFLAFDLRSRDERDRVAAVLDSRPFSNIALAGGRLCAAILAIALPLFAVLLLIQAAGTIGRAVGKWVDPIEPVATFTFYFLDGIPALTLWCAVVLVLAAGLRYRLAIAVAALALIGLHMWSFAIVPAYLLPAVSLLYIHDNWASDLAPRLPDAQIFLHRASMFVLAAALVVLAAALHKRPDGGSRGRRLVLGTAMAAIAAVGIGTVALHCIEGVSLRESWLAAHEAAAGEPQPLVEHVDAEVDIVPGEELRLRVDMELNTPTDLPRLLFSFNPGLAATSLVEFDFETKPAQAMRAFGFRARAAVFSILDGMGRRHSAALLAELRRRHAGSAFDAADFDAAASAIGIDLPGLIGDWLNETALPGFMASRARVVRMADDDQGRPRYETTLHVRNGEPVAGLVRLSHGQFSRSSSDPIRIPGDTAVEVGMVTPRSPEGLRLEPYLALNRLPVRIELAEVEASDDADHEPLVGSRPSAWAPAVEGIVIDDLDPGFSVEGRAGDTLRRIGTAILEPGRQRELDQGLPVTSQRAGEWSRATMATGWGKYRHTVAGSIPGDGSAVAVFAADLPEPGRWRLEYHVPDPHGLGLWGPSYGTLGTLAMTVIADGREVEIAYDGASADVGWNEIDEFEFASTHVHLEVSNRTDGEMVVADAIRWLPVP